MMENYLPAMERRKVLGKSLRDAEAVAVEKLTHVGLNDKIKVYPSKLSGGQQQRMAIARALAMSLGYMLFDEVTSALDPQLVGEVLDTMRMLSSEGMTMIVVTHEIRLAREVSDRVAFFHQGKIHEIGPPQQVIGQPQQKRLRHSSSRCSESDILKCRRTHAFDCDLRSDRERQSHLQRVREFVSTKSPAGRQGFAGAPLGNSGLLPSGFLPCP